MAAQLEEYDVVVVGAGPAGENVAGRVAARGNSVVVVESELVGGECSYWACIPSKTLLRPGDVLAAARRVPGAAAAVTGQVDVAATLRSRDAMSAHWQDDGQVQWLEGAGVALARGTGRLAGERQVDVTDAEGGVRRLHARQAVVLATGTRAAVPPIEGLAEARPWDSRDVTSAKQAPRRLLVLGGGPVAVEMAQAWRWLGVEEVTVVERAERLLPREEPFAGEELAAAFAEIGITVRSGTEVTAVRREAPDGPVTAVLGDGSEVVADEVLVALGRRPATDDLGLETVGLTPGESVEVDDRMRATGVPGGWLYAVGDVNGRSLLTHMGKYQARLAADVITRWEVADWADHHAVSRVVFTDPQVAAVGLTMAQATERGLEVREVRYAIEAVAGASVSGEGVRGTGQIVVDESRRVIVGATFTGPGVGELLHAATVAIAGEVPMERLWHAVPAFPTVSEVWLRLLEEYGL